MSQTFRRAAPVADARSPVAGLSLGRRLLAVFVSPVRLFRQLREQPTWAAPLLISVAVGVLVIVLLPDEVFYRAMQGATTRRGEPVAITSPPEVVAMWERMRLSMGVVFTQPLLAVMLAGALTLVFGRLLRRGGEFRQYFAVTVHAFLISALGALLALPLQVAHADPAMRITPALLLPAELRDTLIGQSLGAINVFTAWMLAALALGVAVIGRFRRAWVPLALLLGSYVLGIGVLAALGAGVR